MPDGDSSRIEVVALMSADERFDSVVRLAESVLEQDRYLLQELPGVLESVVVAAFAERCIGFLRFVIQEIGHDVGRPPIVQNGRTLTEGYVEAFGVDPEHRRRGVGTALQAYAFAYCRQAGCHQMRSRSPVSSTENYALKIAAGYVIQPSSENDSYYFIRGL